MKYAIHSQLWSAVAYSLLCALRAVRGSNVAGSGVPADRIAGLFTCVLFSYTVCTNSPQCTCRPSYTAPACAFGHTWGWTGEIVALYIGLHYEKVGTGSLS